MKRIYISILILFSLISSGQAKNLYSRLYINGGSFLTVDSNSFPVLAFNATGSFSAQNAVLTLTAGDSLLLTIVNKDSLPHRPAVKGMPYPYATISADDSVQIKLRFDKAGNFILLDSLNFPKYTYLGLGSIIAVTKAGSHPHPFYWNIREYEQEWNTSLLADRSSQPDLAAYKPDYYTINGLSFPDVQLDSTAKIWGSVGDTIHIFIANTGLGIHSIHFHGYHCRALYSNSPDIQAGWEKDTWPINSMEAVLLEMIPDKPGEYPVHDHNLIATTGGSMHPNGMMIHMMIK